MNSDSKKLDASSNMVPEELRSLDKEGLVRQTELIASQMQVQMHMGPIPPASEFAKYEKVLPGSADRILKMAEKQSSHRQNMEDRMLAENIKVSKRGQLFAFVLTIIILLFGMYLVVTGKDVQGFITIVTVVTGLAGLFVYNRVSERKELEEKKKEIEDKFKK